MKILLHTHVPAIFLWFSSNKIRKDLIFYFLSEEPRVLNNLRFFLKFKNIFLKKVMLVSKVDHAEKPRKYDIPRYG